MREATLLHEQEKRGGKLSQQQPHAQAKLSSIQEQVAAVLRAAELTSEKIRAQRSREDVHTAAPAPNPATQAPELQTSSGSLAPQETHGVRLKAVSSLVSRSQQQKVCFIHNQKQSNQS